MRPSMPLFNEGGADANVIKLMTKPERLHTKKVWGLFTLANQIRILVLRHAKKATQMAEKPVCRCPDL